MSSDYTVVRPYCVSAKRPLGYWRRVCIDSADADLLYVDDNKKMDRVQAIKRNPDAPNRQKGAEITAPFHFNYSVGIIAIR